MPDFSKPQITNLLRQRLAHGAVGAAEVHTEPELLAALAEQRLSSGERERVRRAGREPPLEKMLG